MNLGREYVKRSVVLCVLILCATLARMISDGAGVTVDPWVTLQKVGAIAGLTSVVYYLAFFFADLAGGDIKLKPTVGKSALLIGVFIMSAMFIPIQLGAMQ